MKAKQATKSDAEWLQNSLEKQNLDTTDFDPLEFIFIYNKSLSNEPIAYGRIKTHTETKEIIEKKENADEDTYIRYNWYEITSINYSPVIQKEKAAKYLLTALINKLKQKSDTTELFLFDQDQTFYTNFGFTQIQEKELTTEQKNRLDEKQTTTKKQISPLHLKLENFNTQIQENNTQIKTEKQKQGFDKNKQQSTKYSV